jgi:hypothetical protein
MIGIIRMLVCEDFNTNISVPYGIVQTLKGAMTGRKGESTEFTEFLAGRLNWVTHPLPLKRGGPPPGSKRRDTHLLRKGVGGGADSDEGTDTLVLCILIPSLYVRARSCGLPEGVGSCLAYSCANQLLLQALHLHDPPKARVVAQVQPRTHTWPSF